MDLQLRAARADEHAELIRTCERTFGADVPDEELAASVELLEPGRALAAYDGDLLVGTAAAHSFTMTVPGAVAPAAGVTLVTVQPTHRRRGVLTAMMRRQLTDAPEAVAVLYASEPPIYGRFGYGLASQLATVRVPTRHAAFTHPGTPAGRVRAVEPVVLPDLAAAAYDEMRLRTPGQVARTPAYWRWRLLDPPHWREGASTLRAAVHETDAGVRGFVLYRVKGAWPDAIPAGEVQVRELVAADPVAHHALWRFLLDLDLMGEVIWDRFAPDDPLVHLLADPRRMRMSVRDGLYARVLDVPAALSQRRYAVPGTVVLDVRDPFLPERAGRFALEGGPDGGACAPTTAAADLTLDVRELGAAYLGGTRLDVLARAGLVEEHTPGAVDRAATMFAWSPHPHQPWIF